MHNPMARASSRVFVNVSLKLGQAIVIEPEPAVEMVSEPAVNNVNGFSKFFTGPKENMTKPSAPLAPTTDEYRSKLNEVSQSSTPNRGRLAVGTSMFSATFNLGNL
jgi:hypothetical protein